MAIHHASSGEVIDVRPLGDGLRTTVTKALYRSDRLEVFRAVLLAGRAMPVHHVPGEVTIQCLEGLVELSVGGTSRQLRAGDLVCLAGEVAHGLEAVDDSSVLVTVLLHDAAAEPAGIEGKARDTAGPGARDPRAPAR